jgi:hypothetical protein
MNSPFPLPPPPPANPLTPSAFTHPAQAQRIKLLYKKIKRAKTWPLGHIRPTLLLRHYFLALAPRLLRHFMQKIFLFVTCKETHSFLKLSAHFGYCTTSRAITIMYKNLLTIDAPKNSNVSFVWNEMCFMKGKSTRAGRAE